MTSNKLLIKTNKNNKTRIQQMCAVYEQCYYTSLATQANSMARFWRSVYCTHCCGTFAHWYYPLLYYQEYIAFYHSRAILWPRFSVGHECHLYMACVMLFCSLVARNGYLPAVGRGPAIRFLGFDPMTIQ